MRKLVLLLFSLVVVYAGILFGKRLNRETYYLRCSPPDHRFEFRGEPRGVLAAALERLFEARHSVTVHWFRPTRELIAPFLPTTDVHSLGGFAPEVLMFSIDAPFWVDKGELQDEIARNLPSIQAYRGYSFKPIGEVEARQLGELWLKERKKVIEDLKDPKREDN